MEGLMAPSVQPKSQERSETYLKFRRRVEGYKRRHDASLTKYETMLAGGMGGAVDRQREETRLLHRRWLETRAKKTTTVTKAKPGKGGGGDSGLASGKAVPGDGQASPTVAGGGNDVKLKNSLTSQKQSNLIQRWPNQLRPQLVLQQQNQPQIPTQQQQLLLICQQQQQHFTVRCSSQQQMQQQTNQQMLLQQQQCTTQASILSNAGSVISSGSNTSVPNSLVPSSNVNITPLSQNSQTPCSTAVANVPPCSTSDDEKSGMNSGGGTAVGLAHSSALESSNSRTLPCSDYVNISNVNHSHLTGKGQIAETEFRRSSSAEGMNHGSCQASISAGNPSFDSTVFTTVTAHIPHSNSVGLNMGTSRTSSSLDSSVALTGQQTRQFQQQQQFHVRHQLPSQQQFQQQQQYQQRSCQQLQQGMQQQLPHLVPHQQHSKPTVGSTNKPTEMSTSSSHVSGSDTGVDIRGTTVSKDSADVLEGLIGACAGNEQAPEDCELNQGELDDLKNFLEDVSGGADFASGDLLHGFDLDGELNTGLGCVSSENALLQETLSLTTEAQPGSSVSASQLSQNFEPSLSSQQCSDAVNSVDTTRKFSHAPPSYSSSSLSASQYSTSRSYSGSIPGVPSLSQSSGIQPGARNVDFSLNPVQNAMHQSFPQRVSTDIQLQPSSSLAHGFSKSQKFSHEQQLASQPSLGMESTHTLTVSSLPLSINSAQQAMQGNATVCTAASALRQRNNVHDCNTTVTGSSEPSVTTGSVVSSASESVLPSVPVVCKGQPNHSTGSYGALEGGGPAAETLKKMAALHRTQAGGVNTGMSSGGYPVGFYDSYTTGYGMNEVGAWNQMGQVRPAAVLPKSGRAYFPEGFEGLNGPEHMMESMCVPGGYDAIQSHDSSAFGYNPYFGPGPHGTPWRGTSPSSGMIPNQFSRLPSDMAPDHVHGNHSSLSAVDMNPKMRSASWQASNMYTSGTDDNDFGIMQQHMQTPAYAEAYRMKQQQQLMMQQQQFMQGQQHSQQQAYMNHKRQQQLLLQRQRLLEKQHLANVGETVSQSAVHQDRINQCGNSVPQNAGSEVMGNIGSDSVNVCGGGGIQREASIVAKQQQQFQQRLQEQQHSMQQQQQHMQQEMQQRKLMHQQQMQHQHMQQQQMQQQMQQQKMQQQMQFQQQKLKQLQHEQLHSMQQQQNTSAAALSHPTHNVGMGGGQPLTQTSSPRAAVNADGSYPMGLPTNQTVPSSYESSMMIGMQGRNHHMGYRSGTLPGAMQTSAVHVSQNDQNYMQYYSGNIIPSQKEDLTWAGGGMQGPRERPGGPVSCSPMVAAEACNMMNYTSNEEFFAKDAGNIGMSMQSYCGMRPGMPASGMHPGMSDDCGYNGMFMR